MILVATKISQVPLPIIAVNSTLPEAIPIFHTKPAVDPFKSGDETSVHTTPELSHVENTCPIRLNPLPFVIQYSNIAEQPKSVVNVSMT